MPQKKSQMGRGNMQYVVSVYSEIGVSHGMNLQQAYLYGYFIHAAHFSFKNKKIINEEEYFEISFERDVVEELPLLDIKKRWFWKMVAEMDAKGVIKRVRFGNKTYIRIDGSIVYDLYSKAKISENVNTSKPSEPKQEDNEPKSSDIEEKWELFWSAYRPINNKDKANSRKAFGKVVGYFDAIMAAIPKYREELDRDTWKQPKMASAWLNAMRWQDYESDETPEKNSANGAAENLSPFDAMAGRLSVIAKELFNSLGVDGVNAAELSAYAFDEKEKALIESAGGFVVVLRNALGGDFKAMYRPVWEGIDA